MNLENFMINRDTERIDNAFKEYKKLYNNLKATIAEKMYVNIPKRKKAILRIKSDIEWSIKNNEYFDSILNNNYKKFSTTEKEMHNFYEKMSDIIIPQTSEKEFNLLKTKLKNILKELKNN